MASPRVFISSTCYDLAEIRDSLVSFFASFGFDVTLSERGDVFYHPDLHTHDACLKETSNCQLFILIIGGRFGGRYQADKTKSITNAEFASAKQNKTPIFAFVKNNVLADHNVWQKNKSKSFAADIEYPSVDRKDHAKDIFDFIDEVRLAPSNNGLFGFSYARDLQDVVRKQLAGMIFDFLKDRTLGKRLDDTSAAVENLANISVKIEELVKKIYKNVDQNAAPDVIERLENRSKAEEFFQTLARLVDDDEFMMGIAVDNAVNATDLPFYDYICEYGYFEVTKADEVDSRKSVLTYTPGAVRVVNLNSNLKRERRLLSELTESYAVFCGLPPAARKEILVKYSYETPTASLDTDEDEETEEL
jgi:hypothetical protein